MKIVSSAKRPAASPSVRDNSPVSPALVVKEPATVLSVKPVTPPISDVGQCDMSTASLSTALTTTIAVSHCLSEEDEVDSSSQLNNNNSNNNYNNNNSSIQSASQYFVSSSGNQPLQGLPKLHLAAR